MARVVGGGDGGCSGCFHASWCTGLLLSCRVASSGTEEVEVRLEVVKVSQTPGSAWPGLLPSPAPLPLRWRAAMSGRSGKKPASSVGKSGCCKVTSVVAGGWQ